MGDKITFPFLVHIHRYLAKSQAKTWSMFANIALKEWRNEMITAKFHRN